jgi:hypothetical protein
MVFHPDELQLCVKHVAGESATDNQSTQTERNKALMKALETLALILGVKPKKRDSVKNQLNKLRKTPTQLQELEQKIRDRNAKTNPETNRLHNLEKQVKKQTDHIAYVNETALAVPSRLSDAQVHFLVLYYALYRKAVDCGALCMQIRDEVKKSFVIKMVKESLLATVTDLRSSKTLAFDARAHLLHICSATLDNADGEAAAFLGSRGGGTYPPIIVCGRFFQRTSLLVM